MPRIRRPQPQQQQHYGNGVNTNNNHKKNKRRNPLVIPLVISVGFNVVMYFWSPSSSSISSHQQDDGSGSSSLENTLGGFREPLGSVASSDSDSVVQQDLTIGKKTMKLEAHETAKSPTTILTQIDNTTLHRITTIYETFKDKYNVRPNKGKCGNPMKSVVRNSSAPVYTASSIEFVGCCGLGHRLGRMAGAAHIARDFHSPFHGYWGCCDDATPVYTYLFGTEPLIVGPLWKRPPNHPQHLQFIIETPGMRAVRSKQHKSLCPVRDEKVESDYQFYSQLRSHYQNKAKLDQFRAEHFTGRTAIGIHIRAGNGELGDFRNKGRQISSEAEFVELLSTSIKSLVKTKLDGKPPPILFIATDTQSYVGALRTALNDTMPVVDLPQVRPEPGQGVFFGEKRHVMKHGSSCLDGWSAVVEDMILLASTDVLLVPKPSSFTETMPASLVMGKPKGDDRIDEPFCELDHETTTPGEAAKWICYDSVPTWACTTRSRVLLYDADPKYRLML